MKIKILENLREVIKENRWHDDMYKLIGNVYDAELVDKDDSNYAWFPESHSYYRLLKKGGSWVIPKDCAIDVKKQKIKEILK